MRPWRRRPRTARPVTDETAMRGESSRKVPLRKPPTSSRTSSSQSASTRSVLVKATSPRSTPRSWQMERCSLVWGMTPSSAATTSMTRSIPPAPASMFFTNRSWPGTSTTPQSMSPPRGRWAKPRSMVMPRSFSSLSRSVSMPVRAFTRAVLPWSMWPAVPRMTCFTA
jgi:hypothetical protein